MLSGAFICITTLGLANLALALPEDGCTVSGVPRTTPSADFTPLGDGGRLRHEMTGLEWQRCPLGQNWDGATCTGSVVRLGWQDALEAAADAGDDWRLPSIRELHSIVEMCRAFPAINRRVFPLDPFADEFGLASFWSASPAAGPTGLAWILRFREGDISRSGMNDTHQVRLVRGGD